MLTWPEMEWSYLVLTGPADDPSADLHTAVTTAVIAATTTTARAHGFMPVPSACCP